MLAESTLELKASTGKYKFHLIREQHPKSKPIILGTSKEFIHIKYESPKKEEKKTLNDSAKACAETASYTNTNENDIQSGQCSEERLHFSAKSSKSGIKTDEHILDDLECNECLHVKECDFMKESPIRKAKEEITAEEQTQFTQLLKQYNPVTKTFFKCSIYSPSHRLYTVNEVASMYSEDCSRYSKCMSNGKNANAINCVQMISNLNTPLVRISKKEDISPSECCEFEPSEGKHSVSRSISKSIWCE